MISCGEKPGSFMTVDKIVPIFTSNLNEAYETGSFKKLLGMFNNNSKILLNSEFNPEVFTGKEEIRIFFVKTTPGTVFKSGHVDINGMHATTEYSYKTEKGEEGVGIWTFRMNNSGKISELTIVPEEMY